VGHINYELNNHLGNVLATITDKRLQIPDGGNTVVDHYEADVATQQDYYPFGMLMAGRQYTANNTTYRYGFNGKENDNEVKKDANGNDLIGGQQDYGMRIYDPRVGRFLSVDPLTGKYPELTPYQFASNTPVQAVDIDGLEALPKTQNTKSENTLSTSIKDYIIRAQMASVLYSTFFSNDVNTHDSYSHDSFSTRDHEKQVIISTITTYIHVNQSSSSFTLVSPEEDEPNFEMKLIGATTSYAFDASKPFLLKGGGVILMGAGGKLVDLSATMRSYRRPLYRDFFSKRYAKAMEFDVEGVAANGKFLKTVGKVGEALGEFLDGLGTVLTVNDVLNPYPGVRSDDEIQKVTENKLRVIIEKLNELNGEKKTKLAI